MEGSGYLGLYSRKWEKSDKKYSSKLGIYRYARAAAYTTFNRKYQKRLLLKFGDANTIIENETFLFSPLYVDISLFIVCLSQSIFIGMLKGRLSLRRISVRKKP